MSKIRVYELAKELNISSKKLIELLMDEFNIEVKNHMSVIEDEDAELIKELLGNITGEPISDNEVVEEYEKIVDEEVNKGPKKKKKYKKNSDEEKESEGEVEKVI